MKIEFEEKDLEMYNKYLTHIKTTIDEKRITHALNVFDVPKKDKNGQGVRGVEIVSVKRIDDDIWRFNYKIELSDGTSISGMTNGISFRIWLNEMKREYREKRLTELLN